MSFTKTQDLSDLTALRADIVGIQNARGTRNIGRAISQYQAERATIIGRSTLNEKRLGLDFVDRKIAEAARSNTTANDAAALFHVDALIAGYAYYTGT